LKIIKLLEKRNPIILIHGLWNNSSIFSSISSKLDDIGVEYFAPTLKHSYGMTSIIDLTNILNELILEKYGLEKKIRYFGILYGRNNW
jgi:triacylglycerol lipase